MRLERAKQGTKMLEAADIRPQSPVPANLAHLHPSP